MTRRTWQVWLAVLVAVANLTTTPQAKVFRANPWSSPDQWAFLTKFCFDESGGQIRIKMRTTSDYPDQFLGYYHDQAHQWPAVYGQGHSCDWKINVAKYKDRVPYAEAFEGRWGISGMRPRWWYFAVANCEGNEAYLSEVEIEMTNKGGIFRKHFSFNEQSIYEMLLFYFFFFVIFLTLWINTTLTLKRRGIAQWQITASMTLIVAVEAFALMLALIDWGTFAKDGVGYPSTGSAAICFLILANALFLQLCIYLSKGWQISNPDIADANRVHGIVAGVFCLYIVLYMWSVYDVDPVSNDYALESVPGTLLICLQLSCWVWFTRNIYGRSMLVSSSQKKRMLFKKMAVLLSLWFISLPLFVFIAHLVDPWWRLKVVVGCELTTVATVFIIMYVLFFRPLEMGTDETHTVEGLVSMVVVNMDQGATATEMIDPPQSLNPVAYVQV